MSLIEMEKDGDFYSAKKPSAGNHFLFFFGVLVVLSLLLLSVIVLVYVLLPFLVLFVLWSVLRSVYYSFRR